MIKVVILFSVLLLAYFGTHCVNAATCAKVKVYTTKLIPECTQQDTIVKWPNYDDQTYFIHCIAPGKPVYVKCPDNQYFVYPLQFCKPCENYLKAVECEQLKTQNPPKCVPIESNGGGGEGEPTPTAAPAPTVAPTKGSTEYPTPRYPSSTTTTGVTTPTTTTIQAAPPTGGNEVTDETTKGAEATTTTPTPTTTTPKEAENTDFPGPPSPPSTNTDIPQPESPLPTPPNVNATPPSAVGP